MTFASGDAHCAAWLYRPPSATAPTACVVMGHGFSLTRHDGLAPYAERLADAGAAVLVFDHRYLGDSGGEPRQRLRTGAQREDWRNAVAFARSLDGVDPGADRAVGLLLRRLARCRDCAGRRSDRRDDRAVPDGRRARANAGDAAVALGVAGSACAGRSARAPQPRAGDRPARRACRDDAARRGRRLRRDRVRRIAVAQRDLAGDVADRRDGAPGQTCHVACARRCGRASASAT